ncbi:MAG: hypothetical protein V1797_07495 [Pseudomonadota bacterium]
MNEKLRALLKTKTFWTGVAGLASAAGAYAAGEATGMQALQVALTGLVAIFLRLGILKGLPAPLGALVQALAASPAPEPTPGQDQAPDKGQGPGAGTVAGGLLLALLVLGGGLTGCAGAPEWLGGGPDNQVTTTYKDKDGNVTKVEESKLTDKGLVAQAKRDIAVARAQNPRKSSMTFAPADPEKPLKVELTNAKLVFEADHPEGAAADGGIAEPKGIGEILANQAVTLASILTGGLVTINAQDRQAEVTSQALKRPNYVEINPSGQSQVQVGTSGTASQSPQQANPVTETYGTGQTP